MPGSPATLRRLREQAKPKPRIQGSGLQAGQTQPRPKPAPRPAPRPAPAPAPRRAPAPAAPRVSGGGGGGGFSGGGGGFGFSPGLAEAEAARQRQLAEMRKSIREQPLDPSLIAQFAARERAADRAIQEAEVAAQRGREQAQIDFDQFIRQLEGRTADAIGGLRGEAAARNLAFQPAFVGVGMRDIRDEATAAQGQAQQHRAAFLSGIDRQIGQATQAREAEVAAIARERARAQADHRQFIERQLAALR